LAQCLRVLREDRGRRRCGRSEVRARKITLRRRWRRDGSHDVCVEEMQVQVIVATVEGRVMGWIHVRAGMCENRVGSCVRCEGCIGEKAKLYPRSQ